MELLKDEELKSLMKTVSDGLETLSAQDDAFGDHSEISKSRVYLYGLAAYLSDLGILERLGLYAAAMADPSRIKGYKPETQAIQ